MHEDLNLPAALREALRLEIPENIEQIEKMVGEAFLQTKEIKDVHDPVEVGAFLRKKHLIAADVPSEDFATLLSTRLVTGECTWDLGLGEKMREHRDRYQRLKDRPAVIKAVAEAGSAKAAQFVIMHIEEADRLFSEGKSLADAFETCVYSDVADANHAFLNLVEEKSGVEIKSAEQLRTLAGIREELKGDVEHCFTAAVEHRYESALEKIVRAGGTWGDLLAVDPKSFGLPEKWNGIAGAKAKTSQTDSIYKVIYFAFSMGDDLYRAPLRDIADKLKAPYGEVLKASTFYEKI